MLFGPGRLPKPCTTIGWISLLFQSYAPDRVMFGTRGRKCRRGAGSTQRPFWTAIGTRPSSVLVRLGVGVTRGRRRRAGPVVTLVGEALGLGRREQAQGSGDVR